MSEPKKPKKNQKTETCPNCGKEISAPPQLIERAMAMHIKSCEKKTKKKTDPVEPKKTSTGDDIVDNDEDQIIVDDDEDEDITTPEDKPKDKPNDGPDEFVCGDCETPLTKGMRLCPKCGAELNIDWDALEDE